MNGMQYIYYEKHLNMQNGTYYLKIMIINLVAPMTSTRKCFYYRLETIVLYYYYFLGITCVCII